MPQRFDLNNYLIQSLSNKYMPKELEDKLKKEYGSKSDIPYKIMNSMGVMHGNKETPKGKAMEKKEAMAKKLKK